MSECNPKLAIKKIEIKWIANIREKLKITKKSYMNMLHGRQLDSIDTVHCSSEMLFLIFHEHW